MEEKVVLFLDYANIHRAAGERRCPLDYADLLQYVSEGRFLVEAHSYVPINPRCEHRADRDIEALWQAGYLVHSKRGTITGSTYRCNFDVEIARDMLKALFQVKPTIMVLASGDADFIPLVREIRQAGVRVEVAAFPEAASTELRLKCSGFIDLGVYMQQYRAAARNQQQQRSEERYRELIRSQQGEPEEEETARRYQDLIRSQRSEPQEQGATFAPALTQARHPEPETADKAETGQDKPGVDKLDTTTLSDLDTVKLKEEELARLVEQEEALSADVSTPVPAPDVLDDLDV